MIDKTCLYQGMMKVGMDGQEWASSLYLSLIYLVQSLYKRCGVGVEGWGLV